LGSQQFNTALRKLLNIRQEEAWYVKTLFLHHFFQGIGVALFFTMANALFLSQYDIKNLPLVYMVSAVALMITGRVYSWTEQRVELKTLLPSVVVLLFASVILLRIGLGVFDFIWLAFLLMVWHRVIYLLSNIQFWGLSSQIFDVRQGKRLFGLISAGDVPAKLLGYLSVSVFVPYIGIENLAVIAGGAFLISMIFLQQLLNRTGTLEEEEEVTTFNKHHESPEHFLVRFFGNEFILVLAGLSFMAMIAMTFVDYFFLSEVKKTFTSDVELAYFLGLFFGLGKGVTIITKLFFSGRLIDQLGAKRSLLILPLLLLVVSLGVVVVNITPGGHLTLLWLFGIMMLVVDIFHYTLHEPVFLALFQPLNSHLRLLGHRVVKGLVNPVGLGIAGFALYAIYNIYQGVNLTVINYSLLVLLGGWIALVFLANRKYLDVLRDAVKKHFLHGTELSIRDKTTLTILRNKLSSDYPEEVIYAVELLDKFDAPDFQDIVIWLLNHPSDEVKQYALGKIEDNVISQAREQTLAIAHGHDDTMGREAAIKAYCQLDDEEAVEQMQHYLESNNPELRRGAITGLMKTGGVEAMVLAGQELLNLINSEDANDKALAAEIIGNLQISKFYKPLLNFYQDDDREVRERAIKASGYLNNRKLLPYLVNFLSDNQLHDEAIRSLARFKDEALNMLEQDVQQDVITNPVKLVRIAHLCRHTGVPKAMEILFELMQKPHARVRDEAINALRMSDYVATGSKAEKVQEVIDREIEFCYGLHHIQSVLPERNRFNLLQKALLTEIRLAKSRLFDLKTLLYDRSTLIKAREGLLNETGHTANALEILDNLLPKMMMHKLLPLYDNLTYEERMGNIYKHFAPHSHEVNDQIKEILTKGEQRYNQWTIATAINAVPALDHLSTLDHAVAYLNVDYPILQQTAKKAIKDFHRPYEEVLGDYTNLTTNQKRSAMEILNQKNHTLLEIEKVVILKSTSIFTESPENILVDLASIVHEARVEEGEQIFQKGDVGYCMYIIYDGEVNIHDGDHVFATFQNRDFFGELSLLDPEPRSASATAKKDSLLLRLDQEAFYELMTDRTEVARGILKILCRRIRKQNEELTGQLDHSC